MTFESLQVSGQQGHCPHLIALRYVCEFSGGTVHLVCRNKGRADAAKAEIVERSQNQVKNKIKIQVFCVFFRHGILKLINGKWWHFGKYQNDSMYYN